jgi:hypothetical protein
MSTFDETTGSSEAESSIRVADINIGYRVFGSGDPLFLIILPSRHVSSEP